MCDHVGSAPKVRRFYLGVSLFGSRAPHSICTSLSEGGVSGLQCWDSSQLACKCGMSPWELRWSWNGGPTDLSHTQLRVWGSGPLLSCVGHFLAWVTTWELQVVPNRLCSY